MSNIRLSLNDLCSHTHRITQYAGSKSAGSTCILMLPRQNKAWVGFGRQYSVRYQENKFIIEDDKGKVREIVCDNPFGMLDQILDTKANYFFMISLDLHRPWAKSELPTMIWIQAKHEIMVDATQDAPMAQPMGLRAVMPWLKN